MKPTMEMINILKRELVTTSRGDILRAGIALEKAMAAAPLPPPVAYVSGDYREIIPAKNLTVVPDGRCRHPVYAAPSAPEDLVSAFAAEVKALCKDFSDLQDRPYMGDVTSAIDSLLERFLEGDKP